MDKKKSNRTGRRLGIAFVLSWLCLCSQAEGQEVIVNRSVTERFLSQSELRAIFSMRLRQWPDGKPIRVFVLPDDNDLHILFAKKILNTFPHQLKRTWDLLVFSGTGQSPTRVGSEREMIEMVATTPGAIGYVSSNYKGGSDENIRVFEVR